MWLSPFDYHALILDGALPGVKELWYATAKHVNSAEYLYVHTPYADALEASPFIGQTSFDDPFLPALYKAVQAGEIPGNWGCFLHTQAPVNLLAQHFRRWITVYDDVEEELFFRFYDPDILPHFASGLTGDERQWFFGPVNAFMFRQPGKDVLGAATANRPKDYDLPAALAKVPETAPWFTLQERHMLAMRPVFVRTLTAAVIDAIFPKIASYVMHLPGEVTRARLEECVSVFLGLNAPTEHEVADCGAFCTLAITSCSHFYKSPEFATCLQRHGLHETMSEWQHYAHGPIPGLELWHDAGWLS